MCKREKTMHGAFLRDPSIPAKTRIQRIVAAHTDSGYEGSSREMIARDERVGVNFAGLLHRNGPQLDNCEPRRDMIRPRIAGYVFDFGDHTSFNLQCIRSQFSSWLISVLIKILCLEKAMVLVKSILDVQIKSTNLPIKSVLADISTSE
jgi:hypothetical protein